MLFIILALASLLVVFFLFSKQVFKPKVSNIVNNNNVQIEEYFCTADVKMCPDGSYVSRMRDGGCKFADCPGEETNTDTDSGFLPEDNTTFENLDWQEFESEEGLVFRAPKEIPGLSFVNIEYWPPKVTVLEEEYVCGINAGAREINGRAYCIEISIEGAAGSTYNDYVYSTSLGDGQIVKVAFTVKYPQCQNYDGLQSEECTLEEKYFNKEFNLDNVIDTIVESVAEPVLAL